MILIVDTETTGLDPVNDRIIEIAAVAYTDSWELVAQESFLVWDETIGPVPDFITEINKITTKEAMATGIPFIDGFEKIRDMIEEYSPRAALAHFAQYDRSMFEAECKRWSIPQTNELLSLPWVCSKFDWKHPKKMVSNRLSHLALDYGIAVDPSKLHRALADVLLLGQVCKAGALDVDQMIRHSTAPWMVIRAIVKPPWEDNGKSTNEAKASGFRWENPGMGDKVPKQWVKLIKDFQLEDEKKNFPYEIGVVR